jgi:hypothetical protein
MKGTPRWILIGGLLVCTGAAFAVPLSQGAIDLSAMGAWFGSLGSLFDSLDTDVAGLAVFLGTGLLIALLVVYSARRLPPPKPRGKRVSATNESIPAMARRLRLSQDAVRVTLGKVPSIRQVSPRGNDCRSRKSTPAPRPAARPPVARRKRYDVVV